MIQRVMAAALSFGLCLGFAYGQEESFARNFKKFKDVAPGIDFFAGGRNDVAAFEKPVEELRSKLGQFLDGDLAHGAIFICSTLKQKDSVYEAGALKAGYRWVLTVLTPEATAEEMMARLKAQMGGEIPEEMRQRMERRSSPEMRAGMERRLVSASLTNIGFAILSTTLDPTLAYRSSRVGDVAKSPLADWLDIGLVNHGLGSDGNLRFLKEHPEEAFPLEDLITMARPFVAPREAGGGGGVMRRMGGGGNQRPGGFPGRPPGEPAGNAAGARGNRGGRGGFENMPKDVQDRALFDAQSTALFEYLLEKLGVEKVKEVVASGGDEGSNLHDLLTRPDMLGPDLDKAEQDWIAWIAARKTAERGRPGEGRPPGGAGVPPAHSSHED